MLAHVLLSHVLFDTDTKGVPAYARIMQDTYVKTPLVSVLWIAAAIAVGVALDLATWTGWLLLAVIAILPLLAAIRLLCTDPFYSLSENIQDALRVRP